MKNIKLSEALRDRATALIERDVIDKSALPDVAELLRVLARIVEGKTIDRAFGAPGDWGYGTPIGDGIFAMLKEPADESGIEWHYTDVELPDDETRVMIAVDHEETEEPDYGYHSDGEWWFDHEPHLSRIAVKVYAWAHAPGVPPKKGGAK